MAKYTDAEELKLSSVYGAASTDEERDAAVEKLMVDLRRNKKSIIAKLSKMGIYVMGIYVPKIRVSKVLKEPPKTKEQLVYELEDAYGVERDYFYGLEKAPKLVLQFLLKEKLA